MATAVSPPRVATLGVSGGGSGEKAAARIKNLEGKRRRRFAPLTCGTRMEKNGRRGGVVPRGVGPLPNVKLSCLPDYLDFFVHANL